MDKIGAILQKLYFAILSLIFSSILAGSVLGVMGLYKPAFVFPFSLLSMFVTVYFLNRSQKLEKPNHIIPKINNNKIFSDYFIYFVSLTIILLLILIPIARWPESIAGDWFPWDAGKYHFPKAIEMVRSGSANDLTIAYGEYPFGYESLLAFCTLLSDDIELFGWLHAIIDIFFILSFWSLARRITGHNPSNLLFMITLLILSNHFFQFLNLWRVFQPELITVGKNDLLLASSLISFLYFYPFPKEEHNFGQQYLAAGFTGMIALSIKPNAIYLIAPLWGLVGAKIIFSWIRNGFDQIRKQFTSFIFTSLIMIPGLIWLLRNLAIQHKIFSEYVLEASKWSIAANLTNPYFYQYIPKNLILIGVLAGLMIVLSIEIQKYRWYTGIFILLITGFIFTPVSAFFLRTDIPAEINWRFGETLLVFVFLLVVMLLTDLSRKLQWEKIIKFKTDFFRIPIVVLAAVFVLFSRLSDLQKKPENAVILTDQFREAVGVDGYYSAYDYIHDNVRDSVVWVENGLPFYAYGPGFSNSVSRKESADYVVVIKTDWFGDGPKNIPSYFDPERWVDYYQVVYEDPQGIVYARKK